MKTYLAIGVILAGFLLSFASASNHDIQYSCLSSQTILKLSSQTNAHGETYDAGAYNIEICYDEIFGLSYSRENEHSCSGTNLVLKLSSRTNAHAEGPGGTIYNTNVCFGDLTNCDVIRATIPTPSDRCEIVSLSDLANAHLGVPGEYSEDENYKIICKKPEGATACGGIVGGENADIINAYWTNMKNPENKPGDVISRSFKGHFVKLAIDTREFAGGTPVSFTIYEEDGFLPDDLINDSLTGVIDSNGNAVVIWEISDEAINKAKEFGENSFKFYFVAKASGKQRQSTILNVNNKIGVNTPPTAKIIQPIDATKGGIYSINSEIQFLGRCDDAESPVDYAWRITKGDGTVIDNSEEEPAFQKIFNEEGEKIVNLRCTDMPVSGESLFDEDRVSILVIGEGAGVHAFIDKPKHCTPGDSRCSPGAVIIGKIVDYDGSSSFAIMKEIVNGVIKLTCLGGKCPARTADGTEIGDPNNKRDNYIDMLFNWGFIGINNELLGNREEGAGKKSGIKVYSDYGRNKINLLLSNSGKSSTITNDFLILRENSCDYTTGKYYDSDLGIFRDTTIEYGICNLVNPPCCPQGAGAYSCIEDSGEGYKCKPGTCNLFYEEDGETGEIETCNDYNKVIEDAFGRTAEQQCNADCAGAWRNSIEKGLIDIPAGFEIGEEKCAWIETTDSCGYSFKKIDGGGGITPTDESCVVQIKSETNCEDGFRTIEYEIKKKLSNGQLVDDIEKCGIGGTKETVCSLNKVQLPFFSIFNIISVIALTIVVYLALLRKKML